MEMPPARKPRWPFQPLMEASRAPSMKALGQRLEVDPRQLRRWRDDGITDLWADRVALRLGLMPEQIWDGWFDVDTSALDAEEAAKRERKRQLKNALNAKYRDRDREVRRAYAAAYRAIPQNADRHRRYSRARYRLKAELIRAQRRERYQQQRQRTMEAR